MIKKILLSLLFVFGLFNSFSYSYHLLNSFEWVSHNYSDTWVALFNQFSLASSSGSISVLDYNHNKLFSFPWTNVFSKWWYFHVVYYKKSSSLYWLYTIIVSSWNNLYYYLSSYNFTHKKQMIFTGNSLKSNSSDLWWKWFSGYKYFYKLWNQYFVMSSWWYFGFTDSAPNFIWKSLVFSSPFHKITNKNLYSDDYHYFDNIDWLNYNYFDYQVYWDVEINYAYPHWLATYVIDALQDPAFDAHISLKSNHDQDNYVLSPVLNNVVLYKYSSWDDIYYQTSLGVYSLLNSNCVPVFYTWALINPFNWKYYVLPSGLNSSNYNQVSWYSSYLVLWSFFPDSSWFQFFTKSLTVPINSDTLNVQAISSNIKEFQMYSWDLLSPPLSIWNLNYCFTWWNNNTWNTNTWNTNTWNTNTVSTGWVVVNIVSNNYITWLQSSWTLSNLKEVSSDCPVSTSWYVFTNPKIWWFTVLGWTAPSYKPFENFVCLFAILDWSFTSWNDLSFSVNVYSWKNVINSSYWWKLNNYHWPWFWDIIILLIIFSLWFNILFWSIASWNLNEWEKKMQKYEFKKHWEITRDTSKKKK